MRLPLLRSSYADSAAPTAVPYSTCGGVPHPQAANTDTPHFLQAARSGLS